MQRQRTVIFLLLMAIGGSMLAYGLHSQAAAVSSGEQSQATQVSEPAVAQGSAPVVTPVVSQDQTKPAESAEVTKTAAEPVKPAAPAKPAAACPT